MKRTTFIAVAVLMVAASAVAQSTVRCESSDGRYVECRTGMLDNVTLSRTLNDSSCVQGQTWGFRNNVIWVDRGCRAEFITGNGGGWGNGGNGGGGNNSGTIYCASDDGKRNYCSANTRGGVQMTNQRSGSACIQGQTWGWENNRIWVDRGCRAEFTIGR